MEENKGSWKLLPIKEKLQYTIALVLCAASIIIAFISFFILYEIPDSVIAIDGLWLSSALTIFGVSMYFHNSLVKYQTKINEEIDRMTTNYDRKMREIEEEH